MKSYDDDTCKCPREPHETKWTARKHGNSVLREIKPPEIIGDGKLLKVPPAEKDKELATGSEAANTKTVVDVARKGTVKKNHEQHCTEATCENSNETMIFWSDTSSVSSWHRIGLWKPATINTIC